MGRLFTRAIRPNPNTPEESAPGTVGPEATPGDPNGVELIPSGAPPWFPPVIRPSPWSGWPAEWQTPNWGGQVTRLTDTAWLCIDLNASVLASMPPYLVGAADSLDSEWLTNPDPSLYTSWEEFAKQLFWDYQLGEAFVLVTARYSTGWPARFHVVAPWFVNVEMDRGRRRYYIGSEEVTADILHLRYASRTDDAHGHGPLEAGGARLIAADVLSRYGAGLAASGGVPSSVLEHPDELSAEQSEALRAQWVIARTSALGEPAVLSGGVTWKATQINPAEMALTDLLTFNESRIAVLLGVPPFLVGLPSGGDSLTYANASSLFDYHWRAGLRPRAQFVMKGLSGWLLPRGTFVELNRDAYVQPEPLVRAQTYQILNSIQDEQGNPVMTVTQIREAERLDQQLEAVNL